MKFWGTAALLLFGVLAFLAGQRLSADALGIAIGVLFGMLASIPAALLVLASSRRSRSQSFEEEESVETAYPPRRHPHTTLPAQAPVIIFAPPAAQGSPDARYTSAAPASQMPTRALPARPENGRAFKVVGEQEEWITEW
jgi:hypothetical protein